MQKQGKRALQIRLRAPKVGNRHQAANPTAPTAASANQAVRYSFSGHETFPFRYTWLPKAIHQLSIDSSLFNREDAMVVLGVGKNMVKSIRHWCDTLGLVEFSDRGRSTSITNLGRALLGPRGWDPYLEDTATLWLLHWLLVSKRTRASTWYLAFTRFRADSFSRDDLATWLEGVASQTPGTHATPASLRRDVEVFLRTYVPAHSTRDLPLEDTFDCPLVELGLLTDLGSGLYQFVRGPKQSLPDSVFLYALIEYWRRNYESQNTLSFDRILHQPGSPGGAFMLSENALVERLERLPIDLGLSYGDSAGIRLVFRKRSLTSEDAFEVLGRYYSSVRQEILA